MLCKNLMIFWIEISVSSNLERIKIYLNNGKYNIGGN